MELLKLMLGWGFKNLESRDATAKKVQCSNELIVNWNSFLGASRPLLGSIVAGEGPREEEGERDNVVAASASVDSVWYILQS